jgi:VWFA-related protein
MLRSLRMACSRAAEQCKQQDGNAIHCAASIPASLSLLATIFAIFRRGRQLFRFISVYRQVMDKPQIFGIAPFLLLALTFLPSFALAQKADSGSAPKMTTADATPAGESADDERQVNIPVVVYDKKGEFVQNLGKQDFVLEVDKKPREILAIEPASTLPITIGLLVDTSASQRDVIADEQTASAAFLDDVLGGSSVPRKAFVVQFARQIDLLQDTTDSKPLLQAGLKQLGTGDPGRAESERASVTVYDPKQDSSDKAQRGGNDTFYDALYLSADQILGKQKGRKVVIILSDGVDSGSKESLGSAIEAAQRADAVVYAIYFKGREEFHGFGDRGVQTGSGDPNGGGYPGGGYPGGGYPGGGYPGGGYPGGGGQRRQPQEIPRPDGRKTLQRVADETGGRLFEVNKKDTIAGIYKEIGDELRAQYRLTYMPDKDSSSEGYHRVVLTLKAGSKDLYVQTRDGYFGGD